MGINILYGASRSDLTKACLEQVYQFRKDHPDQRAILLVPETSKMDMEYEFLTGTAEEGMMLTEVLSFSRFCYRILGEIGSGSNDLIDDAGKSMLLYRVLRENEGRFVLFKNLCQKPGFIAEILSVMGDLKRVLIDASKLQKASLEMPDPVLAQKAKELGILFEEYDRALKKTSLKDQQENYTRTTAQISRLAQARSFSANQSAPWPYDRLEWLFHTKIWILGFGEGRDFTPQEYAMMEALNRCCDLVVTLVCDHGAALFRAGAQSMAWFSKSGLLDTHPQAVPPGQPTLFTHLASCWKDQNPVPVSPAHSPAISPSFPNISHAPDSLVSPSFPLTLVHSATKRQEVAILAGEIKRLIREEQVRYRDITIVAAGMESYGAMVHSVFQEASIPYYLDEKKSLGRTALARMIRSLLDLCLRHWSHKALMNYARCGFCSASQNEIDELETFMLSRGIKWKSQIFDDARFHLEWEPGRMENPQEDAENRLSVPAASSGETTGSNHRMIELRDRLCKNILVFEKNCSSSTTSRDYCIALRNFLQAEEIPRKMEQMSGALLGEKQEDAATALVKAWNELLHLIEQIEQIGQDTPMDLELFRGILASGMEKAVSGTIPSSVDQVHFASINQISGRPCSVLFIIGLSDSSYPEKLPPEGLLKDREREAFSAYFGIDIPSIVSDKYYEDLFLTYSLLGLPTKRLILSCPEPKERESKIVSFVRECVPDCRTIDWSEFPGPFDIQVYSKKAAFHTLVSLFQNKSALPICRQWEALHQVLARQPEFQSRLLALQDKSKNSQKKILLSKEEIVQRYKDPAAMSVSQLETYSACAYAHFAKYLLKLQPRVTWNLQSSDTGSLLHGIVEIAVRQFLDEFTMVTDLKEKEGVLQRYRTMDFDRFSLEKMKEIIKRDKMSAFLDQGFFASKGRTSYRLAASTLQAVFNQFDPSGFIPGILEWEFSQKNDNALMFQLPGCPVLLFQGKVDRIDLDGSYFRVIDYKSGSKAVEFDRWYHGLSLQLPAYIAAFCRQYPDKQPKEAAYMQFSRPVISYENTSIHEIEQKHAQNIQKQYQLRGARMEPEELAAASQYAVDKMEHLSCDLFHGKYDIKPKKIVGKDPPCSYCDYLSICGFESKYDDFTMLEPLEKMQDGQGKLLPKSAVFSRKINEEHKKTGERDR